MMIFDPSAIGYGIFSLRGASILLTSFLLLSAVHSAILTLARIEGISRGQVPLSGHDTASAGTATSGSLLRGVALMPGYLIFIASGLCLLLPTYIASPSVAFAALIEGSSGLAVGALILLTALSGLLDSTPLTWRSVFGLKLAYVMRLFSAGWFLVCCYLAGGAPASILLIAALGFGARTATSIVGRACYLHGIRAIATAPAMLALWGLVTASVAAIGPFERLLRPFIDRPGGEGILLGLQRSASLKDNTALLPACATLDSIQGMRMPR